MKSGEPSNVALKAQLDEEEDVPFPKVHFYTRLQHEEQ